MLGMLSGSVEVDETYVGGKPGMKGISKRGRGTKKTPIVALVERDKEGIRCRPLENVDGKTLKSEIRCYVSKEPAIITDEAYIYSGIGKHYDGGHETVNHHKGEHVRRTE